MKTYILCSPQLSDFSRTVLKSYNITCIDIPPCVRLPQPTRTHVDMLFFKLSDGTILTEGKYFDENRDFFASLPPSLKIAKSDVVLSEKYPFDIAFDALKVVNTLFCLEKHTAPETLCDCEKVINIRQGYAKCSSLVIGDAVITADKNLQNSLTQNGFDCALIESGGIALDGYNFGFIGGTSLVLEKEKAVLFFGDISKHNSYETIRNFCEKKGYKLHFDCNSYPCDLGGALLFTV